MSFEWNASSDEEEADDGFANWAQVDLRASIGGFEENDDDKKPAAIVFSDDEDDDESNVDWEDAAAGESMIQKDDPDPSTPGLLDDPPVSNASSAKLAADSNPAVARQLVPVEIDMNRPVDSSSSSTPRKRKRLPRKKSYRFDHLAADTKRLIAQLQRTHLLCWAATACQISHQCAAEQEILALALSLIPEEYCFLGSAPTLDQLEAFVAWFGQLVHGAEDRRREAQRANYRAGAPRTRRSRGSTSSATTNSRSAITLRVAEYCRYLSKDREEDPQLMEHQDMVQWNDMDEIQLFLTMARSIGWRCRLVLSLDVIESDLNVNHPLLSDSTKLMRSVFQFVWKRSSSKKARPAAKTTGLDTSATIEGLSNGRQPDMLMTGIGLENTKPILAWIEVLANMQKPAKKQSSSQNVSTSSHRWIHVDPVRQVVDRPHTIEALLFHIRAEETPSPPPNKRAKHRNRRQVSAIMSGKRRHPIAYALAVEHRPPLGDMRRFMDVTPRYASSYVETLKARGVLRGKQTKVDELQQVQAWWSQTLKVLSTPSKHESLKQKTVAVLKSRGESAENSIDLDEIEKLQREVVVPEPHAVHEDEELSKLAQDEPLPTSKQGFQAHPVYVIPSVMGSNEILHPEAKKRYCGVFKGELVYRRSDVYVALPAHKWLYKRRKVIPSELKQPVKRVKMRKKPNSNRFKELKSYGVGQSNDGSAESMARDIELAEKPLEDGMEDVYAVWQTQPWSPPPVGPNDPIPVNEYNNIEYELLNPGLVHVHEPGEVGVAQIAKKLGIPYAPCLMGFEGHGGNRTPTIRGIVVHEHNEVLLREAHSEILSHTISQQEEAKEKAVYRRWKRVLVGVLTRERLENEYGEGNDDS